jgi:hypothetical protein
MKEIQSRFAQLRNIWLILSVGIHLRVSYPPWRADQVLKKRRIMVWTSRCPRVNLLTNRFRKQGFIVRQPLRKILRSH